MLVFMLMDSDSDGRPWGHMPAISQAAIWPWSFYTLSNDGLLVDAHGDPVTKRLDGSPCQSFTYLLSWYYGGVLASGSSCLDTR